jgi:hypothetical protein
MSRIKQLSVFVENKTGQITDVTTLLSKNGLSIKSINLVDSSDFGILRLIVDDEQKAKNVLDDNGISLKITDVFAVHIDDHIGSFNEVVTILSSNSINIEYTYTISNEKNGAFVFKVNPMEFEKTISLLKENNIDVIEEI